MRALLIFGRFAHDPQRILTAVYRLALVGVELGLNTLAFELRATSFADAKALFHDPQFSLLHNCSLAHLAGRQ